nr:MAG TPA: hypothetical protein [Caudoviricetes sp.]
MKWFAASPLFGAGGFSCPTPGVEIGTVSDRRIEWLESVAHVAGVEVEYSPTNSLDGFYEHSQRRDKKCSLFHA